MMPLENRPFIEIEGINLTQFESIDSAATHIGQLKTIAVSVNAEVLINKNPDLTRIINLHIGYPDGVGAVLAAKAKGLKAIKKIPGVELCTAILKRSNGKSVFLLGSRQEVLEKVKVKIETDYPSLQIVGAMNGYFSKEDDTNVVDLVANSYPDIVVIAMGQPYQEIFAERIFAKHKCLILCVGGSFDVYSGNKKRAPKIAINFGLEWLYRFLQEPSRLPRYLKLVWLIPILFKLFTERNFLSRKS